MKYNNGEPTSNEFSLFSIDQDHILIDAVKQAENDDKIVLRLHENHGKRGEIKIFSDLNIKSWQECNLMEKDTNDIIYNDIIKFNIKPYEIKTFLIEV